MSVVINPSGLREGAQVRPTQYLHEVWPERYPLTKRGRVRYVHNYGEPFIQHIEVRWDGEYDYRWYHPKEVEYVDE